MFEELKKGKNIVRSTKKQEKIFFKIEFDKKGAYITVVNEIGVAIEADNFSKQGKEVKEILNLIERNKVKSAFAISWSGEEENIYLSQDPFISELLVKCDNIVDGNLKKIIFEKNIGKLKIRVEEENEKCTPLIYAGEEIAEFEFLNEKYIILNDKIYEIEDIGENFNKLELFKQSFPVKELEKYLTLLYSMFINIEIEYEEYETEYSEPEIVKPTVIIDNIDKNSFLYLKTGIYVNGYDVDFLSDYEISTVVHINRLEKKIMIKEINDEAAFEKNEEFINILMKIKKNMKQKEGVSFEGGYIILSQEVARELLTKELSFILNNFELFGTDKLKDYNLKIVKPKVNANFSFGIDFFEGEATIEIEGEKFSLFDAINLYKKNSYIPLNNGLNAVVSKNYMEKLERIFKKKKDKVNISFFDLPIVEELMEERYFSEQFPKYRELFDGFNKIEEKKEKLPKINAELRDYQKYGVRWMKYLYDSSFGGCLADDMGLGKTVQAITFFSMIYPKCTKPSIVIMPRTLLFNWEAEINKFNPELTFFTYYGNNRNLEEALKSNLILTTYGVVRSDIEKLKEHEFEVIVLDESQNIKNINSQAAKAAIILRGKRRMALSGTPIENNLGELYSLFAFLNPSMFGSFSEFSKNYANPIQKENKEEAAEELRRKIYPFILRRNKKDVLKDLPDKVEQTIYVEMNNKQKKLYEERRNYYKNAVENQIEKEGIGKSQFFIFQALNELRQIATNPEGISEGAIISPKREVLMESIQDAVSNRHKVLVFTNYLGVIENIGKDLEENGIEYLEITGAVRDRQSIVEKFQNDKNVKVLIMTLKTGGVGLNLTQADTVFIYDPWWNKAAENQAIDRTHRMGQKNTVFSYKMITKGTIEEKIITLQEKKRELFENLISSDSASIKTISADDISFIMGE